jgi:hypothetical protein
MTHLADALAIATHQTAARPRVAHLRALHRASARVAEAAHDLLTVARRVVAEHAPHDADAETPCPTCALAAIIARIDPDEEEIPMTRDTTNPATPPAALICGHRTDEAARIPGHTPEACRRQLEHDLDAIAAHGTR